MKIITTEKLPIKMWLDDCEDNAMIQIKNLANLPFAFKHIAIMPDCHSGYGMPIGGVLATKGVVIPNAVGVDIGCGMCAVKTNIAIESIDKERLKKIMGDVRKEIPVGFNHHKEKQDQRLMPEQDVPTYGIIEQELSSALKQIGTLGGGNHFIEFQKDKEGIVWVMIHSGSRNLGKKVADYYNEIAIQLNNQWFSNVPSEHELAFLPIDIPNGLRYIEEMNYCVEFAYANRRLMMDRILACIERNILADFEPLINIAHNYARIENHFGSNVIVHRKGATSAREGEIGIIPGSQGSKSYIVRGLGNTQSFMSCSHGAGRKMGRKQACRTLSLAEEIKLMDEQGIIHGLRTHDDLDEAAGAYKPIEKVMNNQLDLVEIVTELSPIAVIKG
jgi:tRNA-splicing ligase RtcB